VFEDLREITPDLTVIWIAWAIHSKSSLCIRRAAS
jgi:hypothetical protein